MEDWFEDIGLVDESVTEESTIERPPSKKKKKKKKTGSKARTSRRTLVPEIILQPSSI